MKRVLISLVLGLFLAFFISYYAKASHYSALKKQMPEPVQIDTTVFSGSPVVNFNLQLDAENLAKDTLYFAVKSPRDCLTLSAQTDNLVLGSVNGGVWSEISTSNFVPEGGVTVMIRGTGCGIRTSQGISSFYIGEEKIPSTWCWKTSREQLAKFKPLSSVLFADSFMRLKAEEGEWETQSGDWNIVAVRNPSRSANAFRLSGKSSTTTPAMSILNLPDWDNFKSSVNLKLASDKGACGLLLDFEDSENFLAVLFNGVKDKKGYVEVVKRTGGEYSSLARTEASVIPGEWYSVELKQSFGRLVGYYGGIEIFNLHSPEISSGKFGLIVKDGGEAEFDDLDVRSLNPAETASLVAASDSWHIIGRAQPEDGGFVFTDKVPAVACLPMKLYDGSIVTGKMSWEEGSAASIFTRGISSTDSGVNLPCPALQSTTSFFTTPSKAKTTGTCSFTIKVESGYACIDVSGDSFFRDVIELDNGELLFGVGGTVGSKVEDISIRSRRKSKIMLWVNEIFTFESTMQNWNNDALHWTAPTDARFMGNGSSRINKRLFSKNLSADMKISEEELKEKDGRIGLALPFDSERISSGFFLELSAQENNARNLTLYLKGEKVWGSQITEMKSLSSIGMYRDGSFLALLKNGKVFHHYISDEELPLTTVGFWSDKINAQPDQLEVSSDSTFEYLFSTAPVEWKVGAGTWEILNRWQCDPRWSWFSGDSKRSKTGRIEDPLALLWWRRKIEGDFTFEMYFGIKMDNARGTKYSYARDINVSLVSDTSDFASGYTFVLGGKLNRTINGGSWILRKDQKVQYDKNKTGTVSRFNLYTASSHRFWFHYILTRRGNTFTVTLTDQKGTHQVFDYEDSDPIDVSRLGIWSYDCGIMLARVRLQTAGYAPMIDLKEEKDIRPTPVYEKPDLL